MAAITHQFLGYGQRFSLLQGQVEQLRDATPIVIRSISHKQLVKRTKTARYAGGQANSENQELLVFAEFANGGQKVVQIEGLLERKQQI